MNLYSRSSGWFGLFAIALLMLTPVIVSKTAVADPQCPLEFKTKNLCASLTWTKEPNLGEYGEFLIKFWEKDGGSSNGPYISPAEIVSSRLWMSSMGHGSSPITVEVLKDEAGSSMPGHYRASQVFFVMGGAWEIWIELTSGSTKVDAAMIEYTLGGGGQGGGGHGGGGHGGGNADIDLGKKIFFERCTGCHGTMRQGATGPALTPKSLAGKPGWQLKQTIENGTPKGMPAWKAILPFDEIRAVMQYIKRTEPTAPPAWGRSEIAHSWKVLVPVADRPSVPEHSLDLANIFAVTLRDVGKIGIIDGDSKAIFATLATGYAVHISRFSQDGRYLYTIGRDGKITMIDLWMKVPQIVAEVRTALEARSIEVAKGIDGSTVIIAGGYWPSHLALFDGQTLELLDVQDVTTLAGLPPVEAGKETRVGAIAASHHTSEFVVNLKEAGKILFVDYADNALKMTGLADGGGLLHDGGFDASKRFFFAAGPMEETGRIAVIDTVTRATVAHVAVPARPHPGRGANYHDPEFGPVWATGHLGSDQISVIATDPASSHAWKVVRSLPGAGTGSLFLKTHPKGKHLWIDTTLSPDASVSQTIAVHDIANPTAPIRRISLQSLGLSNRFPNARLVHPEYNREGSEVWVSVWSPMNESSAILVFDEASAGLKHVIESPDLVTPTGKFNSTNTRDDIY